MNQKQEKTYKHFERPTEPRIVTYKSHSKGWLVTIAILIIVIVALVPVVHHLASSSNHHEQAVELQRATVKQAKRVKHAKKIAANKPKKAKKSFNKVKHPKTKQANEALDTKQTAKTQYIVQEGDTLTSIAQKNNVSPEELARLNGLDADGRVDAGQTLKLK